MRLKVGSKFFDTHCICDIQDVPDIDDEYLAEAVVGCVHD